MKKSSSINNSIMKRFIPTILILTILLLSFPALHGQKTHFNALKVKQFMMQYQSLSMSSSEPDSAKLFNNLFMSPLVPVYDEYKTEAYNQVFFRDFIHSYNTFLKENRIDDINIFNYELLNFTKKKRYYIANVGLQKEIIYHDRDVNIFWDDVKPDTLNVSLIYTIVCSDFLRRDSRNTKNFCKIVKVDKDEFPFVHGIGSPWYIPQSLHITLAPNSSWVMNKEFDNNPGIGFNLNISASYLLTGKEKFNLTFIPGLGYNHFLSTAKTPVFFQQLTSQVDMDGDEFTLLLAGINVSQELRFNYFSIPIDLGFQWYMKKWSLALKAGVDVMIPINHSFELNTGTFYYAGGYQFEDFPVLLDDLPEYGYGQFTDSDIASVNKVEISPTLLSHVSLEAFIPVNKYISVFFGPQFSFGITDIVKEHSITSPITDGNLNSINLLALGDHSRLNALSVNIGVEYKLKRSNVPYINDVCNKDVNSIIYDLPDNYYAKKKKEKISPINLVYVNTYHEHQRPNKEDVVRKVEDIVLKECKNEEAVHMYLWGNPTYYFDHCDSLSRFTDLIYQVRPDFAKNDAETLMKSLRTVSFHNRKINLYFIISSPQNFRENTVNLINDLIYQKLYDQYNAIKIHVLLNFKNEDQIDFAEIYDILENDKSPISVSDFNIEYLSK